MSDKLLSEIEGYLVESGVSATYFGRLAAGNAELVGRLRKGGTVTIRTADKVRKYIRLKREANAE